MCDMSVNLQWPFPYPKRKMPNKGTKHHEHYSGAACFLCHSRCEAVAWIRSRAPHLCLLILLGVKALLRVVTFKTKPIFPISIESRTPSPNTQLDEKWRSGEGTHHPSFLFGDNARQTDREKMVWRQRTAQWTLGVHIFFLSEQAPAVQTVLSSLLGQRHWDYRKTRVLVGILAESLLFLRLRLQLSATPHPCSPAVDFLF